MWSPKVNPRIAATEYTSQKPMELYDILNPPFNNMRNYNGFLAVYGVHVQKRNELHAILNPPFKNMRNSNGFLAVYGVHVQKRNEL